MKRQELQEAKRSVRSDIEQQRNRLRELLLEKKPIPRRIVDGPLSGILQFKAATEKASDLYHLRNAPGATLSLNRLRRVKERLEVVLAAMEAQWN